MITPTAMQLGSLEQVYDIYLYKLCYTMYLFMQCGTLHKKSGMSFTVGRISRFKSVKTLSFEHRTPQLQAQIPSQCERLIALVCCIHDPIFMIDSKIMGITCMRFLFLCRFKNYGVRVFIACTQILDVILIFIACAQKLYDMSHAGHN
jgi:hypothetical protein